MNHEEYHGTIATIHRHPTRFPIVVNSLTDVIALKILQDNEMITTDKDILALDCANKLTGGASASISEWIQEVHRHRDHQCT